MKFIIGLTRIILYSDKALKFKFFKACHSQQRAFRATDSGTFTVRRIFVPSHSTAFWHKEYASRQKKIAGKQKKDLYPLHITAI
jgi:hypothetical protein